MRRPLSDIGCIDPALKRIKQEYELLITRTFLSEYS